MNRLSTPSLLVLLFLSACGGGGDGGGGGGGGGGSAPAPIGLGFETDVDQVLSGGSVTLKWRSMALAGCVAGGGWSGNKKGEGSETITGLTQTTTFSLTCTGAAPIAASLRVYVTPQAAAPNPTATQVFSENGLESLTFTRVPISSNGVAWDAQNGLLLLATRADSPNYASSVVSVDPATGNVIHVLAMPSEPIQVAVSAGGQYVYVGFRYNAYALRLLSPNLAVDQQIPVGTSSSTVLQFAPSPVDPHVLAVVANNQPGDAAGMPGITLYDDAVPRPLALAGMMDSPSGLQLVDIRIPIAWAVDGSSIYAENQYYAFLELAPSAQGLVLANARSWPNQGGWHLHGQRLFLDSGVVYDLVGPVQQLGAMADYAIYRDGVRHPESLEIRGTPARAEAPDRGKVFSVRSYVRDGIQSGSTLAAYDSDRFMLLDEITFRDAARFDGGLPVMWGTDGIAIAGLELLLARGNFVQAGGTQPATASLPVVASGSVPAGSGYLNYRVLDIGANDLVADACGHLYASISGESRYHPNSVVSIDTGNGTVAQAVYAGSEPRSLAVSDDCSTLYAALEKSNSVSRVRLPDFTVDATLPMDSNFLHSTDFARARTLAVAPGLPHTVAVAKADMGWSLCAGSSFGLSVFDDTVERPASFDPNFNSIRSIAWGTSPQVLYGEDSSSISAFAVDANGAANPRSLFQVHPGPTLYTIDYDLYFDRVKGHLFDSYGQAYDTAADHSIGPLPLAWPTPTSGGRVCRSPGATRVTDAQTGRIFFASDSPLGIGISAYDPSSLALSWNAEMTWPVIGTTVRLGEPTHIARRAPGELAFVTDFGYLVLLDSPLLGP